MKKNNYKQLSIKCGVITLVLICLFLPSCSTDKDESFEMPSEEVLERVAAATEVAGRYFSECNSIAELEQHLDEIRSAEGVVNAYIDSQTLYIEYDKIGRFLYHYPIYPDLEGQIQTRYFEETNYTLQDTLKKKKTRSSVIFDTNKKMHHRLNESDNHSLVIYNALYTDECFRHDHEEFIKLEELLKNISCNVNLIENTSYSCYDFFYRDIYQYDLVILDGHGGYDSSTGNHWFVTGERFKYTDIDDVRSLKGYTVDEIKYILETQQSRPGYKGAGIAALHEKYKENGKWKERLCYYWEISDERIASIPAQFNERAIVFSYACNSTKGNLKFADAFLNKGAACFLGYDNTNCISGTTGLYFFEGLMNGFSAQKAYDELEVKYRHDTSVYYEPCLNGDYIFDQSGEYNRYIESSSNENAPRYCKKECNANLDIVVKSDREDFYVCITHPQIESYEEKEYSVLLKGCIKIDNPNKNKYGFALHTKEDASIHLIEPLIDYNSGFNDKCKYNKTTHTLNFEYSVSKREFKDVDQFCAVLYDGERYCLGDMVDIDIEVKDSPCPDDNHPHAIDLGLPSGNLWSCCCLGSTDPSKHGGLYPWGYITPVNPNTYPVDGTPGQNADIVYYGYKYQKDRVVYHGNKYYCDSSYVYIGKDISGSEKDAVWVNTDWKGGWVMPNRSDLEELINYCSYDHNKLIGPNGSYVIPRTTWSSTLGPRNATFPQSYMCAYALSETEIYLELRNVALEIWPVYK